MTSKASSADRTINFIDGVALVPMVGRKGNLQGYAKVDPADVHLISDRSWYARGTQTPSGPRSVYARNARGGVLVLMHKLILPGDHQVDHISGDGLDNRRANLRACSAAENSRNKRLCWNSTTGFKGVSRRYGRFQASIKKLDQQFHLGMFDTAEDAARARDAAAIELFGEFAKLNFPHPIQSEKEA